MTAACPFSSWTEPWLAERAALSPHREALRCGAVSMNYAELLVRARSCACQLAAVGVGAGHVVAVNLPNAWPFVVLFHALRLRRAVMLPLNRRLALPELAGQLRVAGADFLIGNSESLNPAELRLSVSAPLAGMGGAVIAGLHSAPTREECARSGQLDGTMAIVFTSGTGGRPRAALLGAENFLASAVASADLLGASARDRWLACLPLCHVGGLSVLTRSCLAGSTVVLQSGFDPHTISRLLQREAISHLSLVPTMLARLLEATAGEPPPETLRCVLVGGAPLAPALMRRALRAAYPLAPSYGLTETCSQVATRQPADPLLPLAGRLRPLPGVELRIDGLLSGSAPGVGEIFVRGPMLMRGYLDEAGVSADALSDGWLQTGDLGCLDAEGLLQVLGRRDDLMISGGENIHPAEVEAVLLEHPAVAEVGVVGQPDVEFGERPMACWVPASRAPDVVDLKGFCSRRLAGYKVPIAFHRVNTLPRTASGKLVRRRLRDEVQLKRDIEG